MGFPRKIVGNCPRLEDYPDRQQPSQQSATVAACLPRKENPYAKRNIGSLGTKTGMAGKRAQANTAGCSKYSLSHKPRTSAVKPDEIAVAFGFIFIFFGSMVLRTNWILTPFIALKNEPIESSMTLRAPVLQFHSKGRSVQAGNRYTGERSIKAKRGDCLVTTTATYHSSQ